MIIALITAILITPRADDVDFSAFTRNKPIAKSSAHSSFPAQTLPQTIKDSLPKVKKPTTFRKIDKFGRTWEHSSQSVLDAYINEINKKPFTAIDKFGQQWECTDKATLESFISGRNNLFDSIYGIGKNEK